MDDFPAPETPVDVLEPAALKDRIDTGEPVTVLDARMPADFEEWHIDGENVDIVNVPYFEFMDGVEEEVLEQIPHGDPLVVLCAKGGASEFVAGALADAGRDVVHLEDGMNGWARILERVEVTTYDGPGAVYQYQRPSSGCLSYLVVSDGVAAVIDPLRSFSDRYLADAERLDATLLYAFDTHIHADHISGVRALDDAGARGVLPAPALDRGVADADVLEAVDDGETIDIGETTIEAVHTPGHTSGMTSYLVGGALLATGDGLFTESVARPDLEEGDDGAAAAARTLHETLQQRILTLPSETVIAPAHFSDAATTAEDGSYTATVGELTDRMSALSLDEESFVELVLADMPPRPANYEEIIETNLGQQSVGDDEAFELELGPNNCAASQDSLADD
ncbi:MBL fold metallo-hydrolase [Halomarina rubra]|uniref:MBL fold metallo-hydrolase n=1 Tax=Halomarina rubra TaxID=2071873 RepID=A0ABD6AVI6_9EURY|nr:MBL fold metallo-hydrolase [Halomarina rubra]